MTAVAIDPVAGGHSRPIRPAREVLASRQGSREGRDAIGDAEVCAHNFEKSEMSPTARRGMGAYD